MRAYVGVTDGRWYRFLAARPELAEVNFWRPSGRHAFRALKLGEPFFFFKTHYPHNRIVGGGFFSGFVPMRVSDAWELLGPGNGAASLTDLRAQITRYHPIAPGENPEIGCILIRDPRFFPEDRTAAPPPGFAGNIVQGKGYDLAERSAAPYSASCSSFSSALRQISTWLSRGTGPDPFSVTPGSRRTGWASRRSRPWSWMPTTGSAQSPARTSRRFSRPRMSARLPRVGAPAR